MKKFILVLLLCAVSVFAVTTAITTSYDDCYSACKKDCTQKYSSEQCINICVLQCKTQPEPSLVDATVAVQPVITKALTKGDIVQLPPGRPVSCRENCDWELSMCEKSSYKTDCKGVYEKCVNSCGPQIVPQPTTTVAVPPVAYSCQDKCYSVKDECAKYDTDDASCKMKIDSCLMNCNPVEPGCRCPPQSSCGPCPVCPQPGFSCDSECVLGYYKCKSAGADNCGKVIVECLDQCRPILPPVATCDDKCSKIKQVCMEEKITEQECAPKIKLCLDQCSKPTVEAQPVPPTVMKTSVARAEVREPLPAKVPEQRMPEKQGVWSKIMSLFKG